MRLEYPDSQNFQFIYIVTRIFRSQTGGGIEFSDSIVLHSYIEKVSHKRKISVSICDSTIVHQPKNYSSTIVQFPPDMGSIFKKCFCFMKVKSCSANYYKMLITSRSSLFEFSTFSQNSFDLKKIDSFHFFALSFEFFMVGQKP